MSVRWHVLIRSVAEEVKLVSGQVARRRRERICNVVSACLEGETRKA